MTKETPNRDVLSWLQTREEMRLFISLITLGEIEKGIYQVPRSKKRTQLETWFYDKVIPEFLGRILWVGQRTMSVWVRLHVELKAKGIARPSFDSLLEATALEHNLVLVTRNVKNFQRSSMTILNPWDE
jgi:hypothetical protein